MINIKINLIRDNKYFSDDNPSFDEEIYFSKDQIKGLLIFHGKFKENKNVNNHSNLNYNLEYIEKQLSFKDIFETLFRQYFEANFKFEELGLLNKITFFILESTLYSILMFKQKVSSNTWIKESNLTISLIDRLGYSLVKL